MTVAMEILSSISANKRIFVNGKLQHGELPKEKSTATVQAHELRDQENREPNAPSLDALVVSQPLLVLSLPNCPQCEELGALLAARGVPSQVFVKWTKTDDHYPALKAALAVHAGNGFTFPQVFARGIYQGGYKEVVTNMERGTFDALLEDEFGLTPTTVQRWVERAPMVVFSLPNCPQCDVLYEHLEKRGLPASSIFIKWDKAAPEYASLKGQLIKLIGRSSFTFPQTFINADYQGSFNEVIAKSDAGQLDDFFADTYGAPPTVPAVLQQPASAVMAFDDDF